MLVNEVEIMDLGQHFLINKNIIDKIVDALDLSKQDIVLEIGGGKGALTEKIVDKVKKIYVVEISTNLANFLKEKFCSYSNLEVINLDFLKLDLERFSTQNFKIVGNIPYSITSEILHKIFVSNYLWKICVIMLQKEVAEKVLADVGSKFFCKLTLISNFYSKVEKVCDVSRRNFYPQPKVNSAVLKFLPNLEFSDFKYKELMLKIIDLSFKHKRKTLLNSLCLELNLEKNLLNKILIDLGIKSDSRPNEVDIYKYKKITEKLSKFM